MPEERVHERINNILGTVGVLGKYQLVVFTWTFFVGSISQTIDVIIPFAQADMDFRSVKHQHDSRSRDQSLSQSQAILQVQSTGSVANKWFKKCSTIWFKIWSMSLYFEYNTLVLIRGFFYVVAWQGQQITLVVAFSEVCAHHRDEKVMITACNFKAQSDMFSLKKTSADQWTEMNTKLLDNPPGCNCRVCSDLRVFVIK